ncbi:MAG: hypothetical protein JSU77_04290 [Fidelibacterota bacterium]|nr:MAG: hypothetical protein JSU77_04290 [Candidatus Neomarinimicrobiota bacterium]
MNNAGGPPSGVVTLCMVVHTRSGNLANTLHSVNRVAYQMVVVDAGGGGGQAVRHIASEYDAIYLQAPADPDESVLVNTALDQATTPWALFLHQQEVLHADDPQAILEYLANTEALAFDFPILLLNEPSNRFFETRLIRTDRQLRWENAISPSLTASLYRAAEKAQLECPVAVMPLAAIVSLGEPEPEEWELRDTIVRLERELDQDPQAVRYWYLLAKSAYALEERDRAHSAVEEGLNVVSRHPDAPRQEPYAVNGLIGMFCEALLAGHYYPEKTVESLWTIYNNMEGDGRFSVSIGNLLLAVKRENDAIAAQHRAVENFFNERRYHLSLEEGLFKPILLVWEFEFQQSREDLLRSVIEFQTLLNRHRCKMQPLLQYVYNHNPPLFNAIQEILQQSLKKLD